MSRRRRMSIKADPAACVAGLELLRELARAGRDDLDGAMDALSQIVKKPASPARSEYDRRTTRVHAARAWERGDLDVTTRCGREGQRDVRLYVDDDLTQDVVNVSTAHGDVLEVTADLAQVTCGVCRKGLPSPACGDASSPGVATTPARGLLRPKTNREEQ